MSITTPKIARQLAVQLAGFGAEYSWVPVFKLADAEVQKVVVVPMSTTENNNLSRNRTQRVHVVNIGVLKRVKKEDTAGLEEVDADTTQEVLNATEGIVLVGDAEGSQWRQSSILTHAIQDHLIQMNQLTAVIEATFVSERVR